MNTQDIISAVQVSENSLRIALDEALHEARNFDWTGWRLPLFVDEDGEVSVGSWMSQGSWQPGAEELPIKIEGWSMEDLGYEEATEDESQSYDTNDVAGEIDLMVDRHVDLFFEGIQNNHFCPQQYELI